MKSEGHLGRCYLKGREGDAANALLCAAGYNFHLILAWLRALLRLLLDTLRTAVAPPIALKPASFLNGRLGSPRASTSLSASSIASALPPATTPPRS